MENYLNKNLSAEIHKTLPTQTQEISPESPKNTPAKTQALPS
jgi:hypothetical protein